MKVEEIVKKALKENRIIFGYRESLKYIRNNIPEVVIIAKNAPEKIRKVILNSNVKFIMFEGSSKELGTICGRPHPITTIVIRGS
jgi:large subunit ribosomal protein L30e